MSDFSRRDSTKHIGDGDQCRSVSQISDSQHGISITSRIFKAYDIRGIVDETLTESAVMAVGCVFADLMRERGLRTVVVGRDGRLSSERLQNALMCGLSAGGVELIDIGLCTSPMLYFATHQLQTGTGIQITGSHNPPAYNGLKLMLGGETLYGDAIQGIRQRVMDDALLRRVLHMQGGNDFRSLPMQVRDKSVSDVSQSVSDFTQTDTDATADVRSQAKQHAIFASYCARIVSDVRLSRPLHIAIDAGNGVAGAYAGDLFRALGCTVTELFCEVDGNFPSHHPDPSRAENLRDLQTCLASGDAEIGLAFDGDADRLGVVTKDGNIIDADRLLMLFAKDILMRHAGAKILFDVKCSRLLGSLIVEHGGEPLMWKTGHSMLKAKLKETGAPLAGEMSGHFFFGERWYGFDDGLYAGVRLLEILSRSADASPVLNELPQSFSTPEIQVQMPEGQTHALVERLADSATFEGAVSVSRVDGLRVDFADGFGLVRASNTTPVLTLRFEGDTPQRLAQIEMMFRSAIAQCL